MKSLYIKLPSHSFFKGKNKKTCINICVVQKNLLPLHSQNCKALFTVWYGGIAQLVRASDS